MTDVLPMQTTRGQVRSLARSRLACPMEGDTGSEVLLSKSSLDSTADAMSVGRVPSPRLVIGRLLGVGLLVVFGAGCGDEAPPQGADRSYLAALEGTYVVASVRDVEERAWARTLRSMRQKSSEWATDESMDKLRDVLVSIPAAQDAVICLDAPDVYRVSPALKMGLPVDAPHLRFRKGQWSTSDQAVHVSIEGQTLVMEPVVRVARVVEFRVPGEPNFSWRRLPHDMEPEPEWESLQSRLENHEDAWSAASEALGWLVERYLLDNARARFDGQHAAWAAPDSITDTATTLVRARKSSLHLAVGCCLLGFCHGVGGDLDELAHLVGDDEDPGVRLWAKVALELRFGDWLSSPLAGWELVTTEEVAHLQVEEFRRRRAAANTGQR